MFLRLSLTLLLLASLPARGANDLPGSGDPPGIQRFPGSWIIEYMQQPEADHKLIASLPESATTPDMTARWEAVLDAISRKQAGYQGFMAELEASLPGLISQVDPAAFRGLQGGGKPTSFRKRKPRKTASGGSTRAAKR